MQISYFYSSFGWIKISVENGVLVGLVFTNQVPLSPQYMNVFEQKVIEQVEEYLAGTRQCFTLPFRFRGTDFQQRVWQALLAIPYGQTRTYADIATYIGNPNAARAVGAACRANPLHLIIPCHRVVGSNGNLTGYAGGVDRKSELLSLERKIQASVL